MANRLEDFVWRSDFFPRKLSFTKEGKALVAISIGLGIAAVNTGNNLLYLVFGISLALIIISGLLSEANLRGVLVKPVSGLRPIAGQPLSAVLTVTSNRTRFPAFSIEALPLVEQASSTPGRILDLSPGTTVETACSLVFPKRGLYQMKGMVVATEFPFSFFKKSLIISSKSTVLVYPRLKKPAFTGALVGFEGEDESRPVAGRGVEFFGVRDFRQGDNPRRVLHRLSASKQVPVVREDEQLGVQSAWVALVNRATTKDEADVEDAIERAAGLAVYLINQGRMVGLSTMSGGVPPGTGEGQVTRILDFLATVPVLPANDKSPESIIDSFAAQAPGAKLLWVRP